MQNVSPCGKTPSAIHLTPTGDERPHPRGVLQDLAPVVAGASALRREGIANRCELVAGDFFDGVPEGGDPYLLKGIIHDWNDEAAVEILRSCRRAIRPDGTLILLDTVLTGSDDPAQALMDLLMMVLTGGRERTELEFRSLLQKASFFSDSSNLYKRPLYP